MRRGRTQRIRDGFSLMEMLVVLAIIGMSAAIVAPRGSVMLDRITLHAVFFDFQRQMSDLRRQAYRSEQAILPMAPARAGADIVVVTGQARADDDVVARVPLEIKEGFTLVFDRPMLIAETGRCERANVEVMRGERRVMRLEAVDDACRFQRID